MFKKTLATALLVAAIPAVASASWFLSTQALNAGGTIDSRNLTGQVVTDGSIFRSYTSASDVPITVSAASGYTIRSVTAGGVTYPAPASPFTVTIPGSYTDKNVTASFLVGTLNVGAFVTGGGYVSPASVGHITSGYTLTAPLTFTFTPKGGSTITAINGVPSDASIVTVLPLTVNQRATVTFPAGYQFTGDVNLQATAENTSPNLSPILPQSAVAGSTVQLAAVANNVTNPTYAWTYVSGPANVATFTRDANGKLTSTTTFTPGPDLAMSATNVAAPTFTAPTVPGMYKFQVVVSSTDNPTLSVDSMAVVRVVTSWKDAAQQQCQFCHTANGIGDSAIYPEWSSSDHAANGIVCAKCHVGTDSGGHPGSTYGTDALKNVCLNCHNSSAFPQGQNYLKSAHYQNPYGEGVVYCSSCHDQHLPTMSIYSSNHQISFYTGSVPTAVCTKCHTRSAGRPYGLYSSNGVGMAPHFDPANSGAPAFMNNRTCSDCHGHNNTINGDYAQSGHGDVTSSAWAEGGASSPCVRCHTTTGFLNYSTFKVVTPLTTPIKKEVLGCNACHTSPDMTYSPFGNLTTVNGVTGSIRKIAPYPATYTQSGSANISFQFPDVAASNVCIPCHSGRVSGKNIQGLTSNMSNIGFVNSHYKAAAGIMYKSIGFEYYTSATMYSNPTSDSAYYEHYLIGSNTVNADGKDAFGTGTVGPCAGCHMYAPDGNSPGHTLHIFTTDSNGTVTALNNSICVSCHVSGGEPGALDFSDSSLTSINAQVTGFQASLGALQALLQTKGIYYNSEAYPYFYTSSAYTTQLKDWTLGTLNNTQGKNNMGAAFNLNLLTREEGAYAHNRYYTKRLIYDAIDWLQNGSMTGSVNVGAIPDGAPDGHGGTTPVFDINAATNYLGTTRP